ncbi:hypothetical protein [Massilia sp. TWP1-3-3]|uniref:hypothetical protein n=1 Tax=Massilia sp. TWP1-3-3 TaxID=2804573 RepID=UPI003CFB5636
MNFIYLWEGPEPRSVDEARSLIAAAPAAPVGQNPTFLVLAARLMERFPNDLYAAEADDVWIDGVVTGVTDARVFILGVSQNEQKVTDFVFETARSLGLHTYDKFYRRVRTASGAVLPSVAQYDLGYTSWVTRMTKADARYAVNAALLNIFAPHGFVREQAGGNCVRLLEGARQRVHFAINSRFDAWEFRMSFLVRYDALEAIVVPLVGKRDDPDAFAASATFSVALDAFPDGRKSAFEVADITQVDAAVQALAPLLLGQVLPFLDRCRDLAGCNRELSEAPTLVRVSPAAHLILALLERDPGLDALIERHKGEVEVIDFIRRYDHAAPSLLGLQWTCPYLPFNKKIGQAVRHPELGDAVVVGIRGQRDGTRVYLDYGREGLTQLDIASASLVQDMV